jgi:hypothetical protein
MKSRALVSGKRWSRRDVSLAVSLCKGGASLEHMGRMLGRLPSAVQNKLRSLGVIPRRIRTPTRAWFTRKKKNADLPPRDREAISAGVLEDLKLIPGARELGDKRTRFHCNWPLPVQKDGLFFCPHGRDSNGGPYCQGHRERAHPKQNQVVPEPLLDAVV